MKKNSQEEINEENYLDDDDSSDDDHVSADVNREPTGVREELKLWGKYTTWHGVPIIFRASNWPIRLFWLSLFLATSAICCYMLATTFIQYFSYEVITKIRQTPKKSLLFPAVTVCNAEFFATRHANEYVRRHFRENFGVEAESYGTLVEYFERNKLMARTARDEIDELRQATYLRGQHNETLANLMGYTLKQMFFSKTFGGKEIDDELIKWIWDPTFGNCFKINYNQEVSRARFDVNNPDVRMRLELLSRIDNAQLSTQAMRGLIIEIAPANSENGSGGYPFVFEWTPVEPGTHTDIVIAVSTARVMPKPFSSCVDIDLSRDGETLSPILMFMKKMRLEYSREFCLDVYSQYLINKELNCYDPTLPSIPDSGLAVCNKSLPTRAYRFREPNDEDECPLECNLRTISSQFSSDVFPSRNYAKEMIRKDNDYINNIFGTNNVTYEMIKSSFSSISIKFESLSVTELIEEPAVTKVALISNIGGIAGLFLAPSFLTCIELFDLAIAVSILTFKRR